MKKQLSILIFTIFFYSCKNNSKCIFTDHFVFNPAYIGSSKVRINAIYLNGKLTRMIFLQDNSAVREDTVVYAGDSIFVMPTSHKECGELAIAYSRINDITSFYLFSKSGVKSYKLVCKEQLLSDSTLSIRFVKKESLLICDTLSLNCIQTLLLQCSENDLYPDDLSMKYLYTKDSIKYKIIEHHENWKVVPAVYSYLQPKFGIFYLDLDTINRDVIYPIYQRMIINL